MNYYYVYKEKVLVDTIKASGVGETPLGSLVFIDENFITIRIMADEIWDDVQLKWEDK